MGMAWNAGQLRFRRVEFMVGVGYTQVKMSMDLKSRRELWAREI